MAGEERLLRMWRLAAWWRRMFGGSHCEEGEAAKTENGAFWRPLAEGQAA